MQIAVGANNHPPFSLAVWKWFDIHWLLGYLLNSLSEWGNLSVFLAELAAVCDGLILKKQKTLFFWSLKGDLNCLYCNLITAPGKSRYYGELLFSKEEEEKVMWFGLFKIFLRDPVKLKTDSEEFVNLQFWSTNYLFCFAFFFFSRNLNFVDHWGLTFFFQPLCSRASTMLMHPGVGFANLIFNPNQRSSTNNNVLAIELDWGPGELGCYDSVINC